MTQTCSPSHQQPAASRPSFWRAAGLWLSAGLPGLTLAAALAGVLGAASVLWSGAGQGEAGAGLHAIPVAARPAGTTKVLSGVHGEALTRETRDQAMTFKRGIVPAAHVADGGTDAASEPSGLTVGDRITLTTADGRSITYHITGLRMADPVPDAAGADLVLAACWGGEAFAPCSARMIIEAVGVPAEPEAAVQRNL